MNRRLFFKKTALAGAGAMLIPEIVNAAIRDNHSHSDLHASALLKKDAIILLQGDSITDAGRKRDNEDNANAQTMLGSGYPLFITANLLANHPDKSLKIYNRGISGNKVFQLRERWTKDCIDLKPDVVSILIGVNDYWHAKVGKYDGTLATYDTDYRNLISYTKEQLPQVKLVICEPFIITGGSVPDDTWEGEFTGYRKAAEQIARDFGLIFVPFQSVFNEALKKAPAEYWGKDGVHPSMAGAQLMAEAWLKAVL